MRNWRYIAAALALLAPAPAAAEPLVPDGEIVLPETRGRIDHLAIDVARQRLLVAELGNNTVDIVDIAARRRTARVAGLAEPQGVGVAPDVDRYAVANAGDGSMRFYRSDDLQPAGSTNLGSDADNVRIDAKSGRVLVGYGNGGIATIDPATGTKIASIDLPAHPEGFQLDPAGVRIYVNLPNVRRIAAIDRAAGRIVADWSTEGLSGNFPLSVEGKNSLAAAVFRNPPTLIVYDTVNGSVRSRVGTCGDADDVFFDAKRQRIYVSCGSGSIDILETSVHGLKQIARVATASGARTSLFVPELDRLFVAVRAGVLGGEAAIRVFRPGP